MMIPSVSRSTSNARLTQAVGNGTTDDTAVLQSELDALDPGETLELRDGGVYSVTNLVLPNHGGAYRRCGIVARGGYATIKARSGGVSTYMVAPYNWVNDSATTAEPWAFENVIFDGNKLVDSALVMRGYFNMLRSCHFRGGLVSTVLMTMLASDGTTATTSCGGNTFEACLFVGDGDTTSALLRSVGSAIDNNPADNMLLGNVFDGNNATPHGLYLASLSGWHLVGNNAYGFASEALRIGKTGAMGPVTGNIFAGVRIDQLYDLNAVRFGPGNLYVEDVTVHFADDDTAETVVFTGEAFGIQLGVKAKLVADTTHANKRIYSLGNSFETDTPHAVTSGAVGDFFRIVNATAADAATPQVGWSITHGSATKTTASAPYANDGYITVTLLDGSTVKVMTTA